MSSLTLDLGRFVAELNLRHIPAEGCAIARTGIADCFGVLIAGARGPEIALVDRELGVSSGASLASLIPSGARRSIESAALINGVAAHVLDYDDVALDGHPSAVLVPAILAQGEASGASGAEMLTAYVAGFEVWAELLAREPTPLHRKGWHPSAVLGTVAAAAACAKLRGLNAAETATALAIAASMSAGLVANFGSMTKSFQVARAAQSGVIAARLAQAGLTASPDALEHPSGLLAALSPEGKAERDRPFVAAQKEWHIVGEGLNIKRYPICYATHRSIDAALGLVARHDLKPNAIERIHVSTGEIQLRMLRNSAPQSGTRSKILHAVRHGRRAGRAQGWFSRSDRRLRAPAGRAGDLPAGVVYDHRSEKRLQLCARQFGRNHHQERRHSQKRTGRIRQGQPPAAAVARGALRQIRRLPRGGL